MKGENVGKQMWLKEKKCIISEGKNDGDNKKGPVKRW